VLRQSLPRTRLLWQRIPEREKIVYASDNPALSQQETTDGHAVRFIEIAPQLRCDEPKVNAVGEVPNREDSPSHGMIGQV
jgi:hypothetical protein